MRIAIVGGGAFGLAGAIEAARRGHRVELFEHGELPHPRASSTDVSKAVRSDYGGDRFYAALADRALAGWRALDRRWGGGVFHETGIVLLAERPLEQGGFEHDGFETARAAGRAVERLDAASIARRFPAFRGSPYVDGYLNPAAGWVASALAVGRLADDARAAGVALRTGCGEVRPRRRGGRIDGIEYRNGAADADVVLVAAGAWTPWIVAPAAALLRPTGQPVRHLRPADRGPFDGRRMPVWCGELARSGWYGFPATAEGIVKIGNHGPGVAVGPDTPLEVGAAMRARFDEFVERCLPTLRGAPVSGHRLCLYCDAVDGDFLIDRVPGDPGLAVAAGGSGHGFKFAPVLGPIVVDMLEGRANPDGRRFAWRRPPDAGPVGARAIV